MTQIGHMADFRPPRFASDSRIRSHAGV